MKPPPLASAKADTEAPECEVIDTLPSASSAAAALPAYTVAPNVAVAVGTLKPRNPNAPPRAVAVEGPDVPPAPNVRSELPSGPSSLLVAEVVERKSKRRLCPVLGESAVATRSMPPSLLRKCVPVAWFSDRPVTTVPAASLIWNDDPDLLNTV